MSVYSGERYLPAAIESILTQTLTDFEFIIIDDGSTDGTRKILDAYRAQDKRIVLLCNETNIGLTRSLNKGLAAARGEYIARQDADDISLPQRFAAQVSYLQEHPHIGLIGAATLYIDADGYITNPHWCHPSHDAVIRWKMLLNNSFFHSTVLFRRQLLAQETTFYDEELLYSQDYEFWARLLRHTTAANLPTQLVAYRVHHAAISVARQEEQQTLASQVAARQINTLLPDRPLTLAEVAMLRGWYSQRLKSAGVKDMAFCWRTVWQLLRAFEKRSNIDPELIRQIRRREIRHLLKITPPVKELFTIISSTKAMAQEIKHLFIKKPPPMTFAEFAQNEQSLAYFTSEYK
jgi:glycosyltransferase involved in cell wall biosynthesis